MSDISPTLTRRMQIKSLEETMRSMPGAIIGNSELLPLKHTFGDGIYVRDLTIPKGVLVVGKIHKYPTLNILLKGDITIMTEDGSKRIKAPHYFIAPPGNKKVGYTHEETIWLNVLATEETDLDKIEEYFIAKDFSGLDSNIKNFIEKLEEL
jgi:hypothetical protein